MTRTRRRNLLLLLPWIAAAACAGNKPGPAGGPVGDPKAAPAAASCDSQGHTQPFLISWDATERSDFELQIRDRIVFVRYDGCDLRLMGECSLGAGAYLEPQWAPGELETVDIQTENQLMKVLPLAASMIGARVSSGESFHMEYFVAGTRQADQDAVSAADLAGSPGCEGVTHFVHAVELGAMALGSAENLEVGAGGSAYGFQAEASASQSRSLERKDGDLSACSVDDPAAAGSCQAPIRVTLRAVQ